MVGFIYVALPLVLSMNASSISCEAKYYRLSIPPRAVPVSIAAEAKDAGGFAKLAARDRADYAKMVEDNSLSASDKAYLISFLNQNIRAAACWAALGERPK